VKKLPVNLKDLQTSGKLNFDLTAILFTFIVSEEASNSKSQKNEAILGTAYCQIFKLSPSPIFGPRQKIFLPELDLSSRDNLQYRFASTRKQVFFKI